MPAALVPLNYVEAVQRAGGVAVLIPPDDALAREPAIVLDRIDGLLLIGGPDVEAARYGAEAHPLAEAPVRARDATELRLVQAAAARGLPTLGICRGMQVINVAAGGTLRQHLPDEVGHEDHRRVIGSFDGVDHDVRLHPGSRAAAAAGGIRGTVKSHHHQGVAEVGAGLEVTAWSELDDLPEAIEDRDGRFLVGVQWHPEADAESRVIAGLVEAARARVDARTPVEGRGEGEPPFPPPRQAADEVDR